MPFRYVQPQQGLTGLQYGQPQQKDQDSPFSQIKPQNIKSAYDMYTAGSAGSAGASGFGSSLPASGSFSLMGGGGATGAGGLGSSASLGGTSGGVGSGLANSSSFSLLGGTGASSLPGGAGAASGAGGASGASGMGSAAAAAGPWAALAAIIGVNEYNAKKGGYRSEDKKEYTKDLFSGEVFHQDMEKRWLPKLGLDEGSKENKWASVLANPIAISADPEKSWKRIKDLF